MGCETETESGKFDAHGPTGTIKGNMGDLEVSVCCGSSVEEIDDDLHDWWFELRNLAEEKDVEWIISDFPEDHRDAFEDGDTVEEEFATKFNQHLKR
jgi:hypothetical protein